MGLRAVEGWRWVFGVFVRWMKGFRLLACGCCRWNVVVMRRKIALLWWIRVSGWWRCQIGFESTFSHVKVLQSLVMETDNDEGVLGMIWPINAGQFHAQNPFYSLKTFFNKIPHQRWKILLSLAVFNSPEIPPNSHHSPKQPTASKNLPRRRFLPQSHFIIAETLKNSSKPFTLPNLSLACSHHNSRFPNPKTSPRLKREKIIKSSRKIISIRGNSQVFIYFSPSRASSRLSLFLHAAALSPRSSLKEHFPVPFRSSQNSFGSRGGKRATQTSVLIIHQPENQKKNPSESWRALCFSFIQLARLRFFFVFVFSPIFMFRFSSSGTTFGV